jgi:hypothetical protein
MSFCGKPSFLNNFNQDAVAICNRDVILSRANKVITETGRDILIFTKVTVCLHFLAVTPLNGVEKRLLRNEGQWTFFENK